MPISKELLQIAPDNIAANRRMLAWADGSRQLQAAYALIRQEHNFDLLRKAIQVLIKVGQRNLSNMVVLEDAIEGWAVWQDEALPRAFNFGQRPQY